MPVGTVLFYHKCKPTFDEFVLLRVSMYFIFAYVRLSLSLTICPFTGVPAFAISHV